MSEKGGFKGQKVIPAKNKTPAPVQITAEQLLREAKERQLEYVAPVCRINFLSYLAFL
jgi:crooked neck